ncbi:M1 family metallopeptidase [Rubricoccus marinus]|uniref:Peptidase M1 membrane alanine aminopeptidase domain-containing protein n=1 Tax=Rubricoccus marinus TaxID=716817 RepID=A0A259TUL3_9BACT|nr:M1 family metallopeptidase [Rubricoccus marinus]OZC01421.1 hypothetical protein BSZ36_17205 [Rubricoccus marinus]
MTRPLTLLATTALLALGLAGVPHAQPVADSVGHSTNAVFEPYALPTPNEYRSASGRPGPAYWQNRNDYRIEAALDTTTHTLSGTVRLTYTNESPEALDHLWFHLEQNLFREGSRGDRAQLDRGVTGRPENGYRLGTVTVDGQPVTPRITDTRMRVPLPEPLAPGGGRVEVVVPYTFVVPGPDTPRMGRMETARGTVYSVAQWFPRVAVFDDVNGWNAMPYLGAGEFYLGYGDVEMALTVPSTMTVVGTGELLNPDEVYTEAQRQRLAEARRSSDRVYVVGPDEVGTAAATPRRTGTTTWRYRAETVRDVSWAASAAFVLDGAAAPVPQEDGTTNDVLVLSAYPHEGIGTPEEPGWEEATRYGRASILNNSTWLPYPYPVAISVASHVGGMEYPMIHFSSVESRHFALFGVIDHELAHVWYPMIVGSDERRHAWMDEGFNTFVNELSARRFYDENDDPTIAGYGEAERAQGVMLLDPDVYARLSGRFASVDDPVLTYPDHLSGAGVGWNAYFKPGMGLRLLRTVVLDDGVFDEALREYTRRWAYKHPQPADFFRTVEDVSGEDLDWFWRGWFDSLAPYDAALVRLGLGDGIAVATVTHETDLVMPATVEFAFADGTTERVEIPVEAFFSEDEARAVIDLAGRTVVSARLDPDALAPDVDRANDARDL